MRFLYFFDQTFLGLRLGNLVPARENLVSDILAGDRKSINLYLQCIYSYSALLGTQRTCLLLVNTAGLYLRNIYIVFLGWALKGTVYRQGCGGQKSVLINCAVVNILLFILMRRHYKRSLKPI